MKKILLAALFVAVPATAFAGHETPVVGEVRESGCGFQVDGYELTGVDARAFCGRRVEVAGAPDGVCDHCGVRRFRARAFYPLRDARFDFVARGTIMNRQHGKVYVGYAPVGMPFDPARVRFVREVCGNEFAVTIRPRLDDPCGTAYSVVAFTDATRHVWDGCRFVRMPRFACAGTYVFDRGCWSDGTYRFRTNRDSGLALCIR